LKPDDGAAQTALNPQSWNLYNYVLGNPLKLADPTGHQEGTADQQVVKGNPKGLPTVEKTDAAEARRKQLESSAQKRVEAAQKAVEDKVAYQYGAHDPSTGKSDCSGLVGAAFNGDGDDFTIPEGGAEKQRQTFSEKGTLDDSAHAGDAVFLSSKEGGTAEHTGIVTSVDSAKGKMTVVMMSGDSKSPGYQVKGQKLPDGSTATRSLGAFEYTLPSSGRWPSYSNYAVIGFGRPK
jgi:cell wall-associated NlpC family hydrolase